MADKRRTVYLPPGIYGMNMLFLMYPPDKFKVIIRKPRKKRRGGRTDAQYTRRAKNITCRQERPQG